MGNELCDTCVKSDVCRIADEVEEAAGNIRDTVSMTSDHVSISIACDRYCSKDIYVTFEQDYGD